MEKPRTEQGVAPPGESDAERRERTMLGALQAAIKPCYQLTGRRIGRGAMGAVYEARRLDRIGERVAIKVMLESGVSDGDREQRFTMEVAAMARVRHTNVVRIIGYDGGEETALGYAPLCVIMELLRGPDLANYIASSDEAVTRVPLASGAEMQTFPALALGRALDIIGQIVDGVGAAHEEGILHRDLKPENVIMHAYGAGTVPVVTDFGLAKIINDANLQLADGRTFVDQPQTVIGAFCGTPDYMSPEAWKGLRVKEPADLFAAGCILYEMLTGFSPGYDVLVRSGNDLSDFHSWMAFHLQGVAITPVTVYRNDIGPWIDEFMARALERDPAKRFQTAAEFRQALDFYRKREQEHPPTEKLAAVDAADQRFWRAFATVAAVLSLALASGLGFMAGRRTRPPVAALTASSAPVAIVALESDAGPVPPVPVRDAAVPAPDVSAPTPAVVPVPADAGEPSRTPRDRHRGPRRPSCGGIDQHTGLMVPCVGRHRR